MHNACMSNLIQIRNVPEDVSERLKARAAAQGRSLNAYMLDLLESEVGRPSKAEVVARLNARGPLGRGLRGGEAAELIREARAERDAQLMAASSDPVDERP
jgi:plasmid stability protein